jgi:hypothetical protein
MAKCAGEVFVECAGKTGFPGLEFLRQGENGSRTEKCNWQDHRIKGRRLGVY